jgi:HK97 family phage prohead protease
MKRTVETQVLQPPMFRAAEFRPQTADEKTRTITLCWSTGARVRRRDYWTDEQWDEELALERANLKRLNSGRAALLADHNGRSVRDGQVGVVVRAWIDEKGEGLAEVRFSMREDVTGLWNDVRTGIVANVSFGYRVMRWLDVTTENDPVPVKRAVDWEPYEISLVCVPADTGAGVRAQRTAEPNPCVFVRETDMDPVTPTNPAPTAPQGETRAAPAPAAPATPAPAPTAPATRTEPAAPATPTAPSQAGGERASVQLAVLELCRTSNVPLEFGHDLIRQNLSLDDSLAKIRAKWAERAGPDTSGGGQVTITVDERTKLNQACERALLARTGKKEFLLKDDDGARDFAGLSLMEMSRTYLERSRVNIRGKDRMGIAGIVLGLERSVGMHSTSDFPEVLANVANKILRNGYQPARSSWRPFVNVVRVPDFKENSRPTLGGTSGLLEVTEHSEIKGGAISEYVEKYRLKTYGRRAAVTRQAIINDDQNAFTRLPELFSASAMLMESNVVYALFTANAGLGSTLTDGLSVAHATHVNVGTKVLGVAGLSEAREVMSKQKNPSGELINVQPAFIVTPISLQTTAEQLLTAISPALVSSVNPFQGKYPPIADPRLDVSSTIAWWALANPAQVDTIEVAFLEGGPEGPRIETRQGWEVEGLEIKCVEDFGAAWIDFRGAYRSTGAV